MRSIVDYVLPKGCALGFKIIDSYESFWALDLGSITRAPVWSPDPLNGNGILLWAWAQGDPVALPWAGWNYLAVEYEERSAIACEGYVKVPQGRLVAIGEDSKEVSDFIRSHAPPKCLKPSFFDVREVGDRQQVTVGSYGVARAGVGGKAAAGLCGHVCVGRAGSAHVGDGGYAEAGDRGEARAGNWGTARVGVGGTASAGRFGTVYAGMGSKAKTGCGGTIYFTTPTGQLPVYPGSEGVLPGFYYKIGLEGIPVSE